MEALNEHKKTLNGAKVLVLGAAYKKDVDDMRESPSLRIMSLLKEKGAEVELPRPVRARSCTRATASTYEMKSVPLDAGDARRATTRC